MYQIWQQIIAPLLFGAFIGFVFGAVLVRLFGLAGYKRLLSAIVWFAANGGVISTAIIYLDNLTTRLAEAADEPEEVLSRFVGQVISYLAGFGIVGLMTAWPITRLADRELLEIFAPLRQELSNKEIRAVYLNLLKKLTAERAAKKMRVTKDQYEALFESAIRKIAAYTSMN